MSRVDAITIQNPCAASWSEMEGTGGRRFCRLCSKFVTDTTSLTACELEKLLDAPEKPCLRVQRDRTGRVLTFDRLATVAFFGLAGCASVGGETAETAETASWIEDGAVTDGATRPMGTGSRVDAVSRGGGEAEGGVVAELVERARKETGAWLDRRVEPKIGDVADVPPVMMGGIAPPPPPMMGEPVAYEPEVGKIRVMQEE